MNPTRRFNRRRFLAATTALTAAPFILPARVWAATVQPNERLAVGFIGMGTMNRGHLGGFLGSAETQVVAVCDVDTNRRMDAKQRVEAFYAKQAGAGSYQGCAAYNDFRELLARKDIDAVVIATPDHWHAYTSIAAAEAGKDIYCEKPLCQSIGEARAMVQAVRRNQRVFQTGSQQRSSREFRVACELVRNGIIGRIQTIEVAIGGPGIPCNLPGEPEEPGLDWNLWLGPAPERPYHSELSPRGVHSHFPNWRRYREYGGGMVTDWGAHHFDIAQWAMGMDESGPVEVIPAGQPNAQNGARYRYINGTEVVHVGGNGVTFHGTEGRIYVNRGQFKFWLGAEEKAGAADQAERIASEYLPEHALRLYSSNNHRADWLNCIRSRQKPICDAEVGARTVSVCHLVNLSYYHGQPIQWDPINEQFVGGTGNREWLNVPHRAPWQVG